MIELRKITDENFRACISLDVHEEQKGFVASNVRSLAQAWIAHDSQQCIPLPFAIYNDDAMVGFVMLAFETSGADHADSQYYIWRFMIDKNHQGQGYGRAAMAEVLKFIRTYPCGTAARATLSYEPDNVVAKRLYASFGFFETGEITDGEIVAQLDLT